MESPAVELLASYFEAVYTNRNPQAARRFVADPCLRHEVGGLDVMSIDDNVVRIEDGFARFPGLSFRTPLMTGAGEFVTVVYELIDGDAVLSGMEVFRVVGGLITETWNVPLVPGEWG